MADVFQILISVFCPTQSAANNCSQFVMNHQANFGGMEALFYFVLFPTVFLLLFVFILVGGVGKKFGLAEHGKENKLIPFLLSITFYIFIIISGWYPIFLYLSEVWYIGIILIFGLWVFTAKFLGGGSDSGGGGQHGGGGRPGGGLAGMLTKKITGEEEGIKHKIENNLKFMENLVKNLGTTSRRSEDINTIRNLAEETESLINDISVGVGGRKIDIHGYQQRLKKIVNRVK